MQFVVEALVGVSKLQKLCVGNRAALQQLVYTPEHLLILCFHVVANIAHELIEKLKDEECHFVGIGAVDRTHQASANVRELEIEKIRVGTLEIVRKGSRANFIYIIRGYFWPHFNVVGHGQERSDIDITLLAHFAHIFFAEAQRNSEAT